MVLCIYNNLRLFLPFLFIRACRMQMQQHTIVHIPPQESLKTPKARGGMMFQASILKKEFGQPFENIHFFIIYLTFCKIGLCSTSSLISSCPRRF